MVRCYVKKLWELVLVAILFYGCEIHGFVIQHNGIVKIFPHLFATFGHNINANVQGVVKTSQTTGNTGCDDYPSTVYGNVVMIKRGSCRFVDKALQAQKYGAVAVVIGNTKPSTMLMGAPFNFNRSSITVPVVSISSTTYDSVLELLNTANVTAYVNASGTEIPDYGPFNPGDDSFNTTRLLIVFLLIFPLLWCMLASCFAARGVVRRAFQRGVRFMYARNLPHITYEAPREVDMEVFSVPFGTNVKGGENVKFVHNHCAICLEDFDCGDTLTKLPCNHAFHRLCIEPWITERSDLCPVCKRSITLPPLPMSSSTASDTVADNTDETSVVSSSRVCIRDDPQMTNGDSCQTLEKS